ncbi:MAG: tripartite tricarboxylate transporter substrate binding protein [Pseudomonadota bacterium]
MERLTKSSFAILLFAAVSLCYGMAAAQTYPSKPVRVIVSYSPGGAADIIGRLAANELSAQAGQQFVVDNRPGAGGTIGAEVAAHAKPDGYTLLVFTSALAISPSLLTLRYDPVKDLAPIAKMAAGASALVVHPSVPVNSLKDFLALARKNPGKIDFAASAVGSFTNLSIELFRISAGIDIMLVGYKASGAAMADLIGGQTHASISSLSAFVPYIRSGRLKLLGTGGAKRSALFPDVPTIAEAGVPGYEADAWFGLVAPGGTPKAIIDRLNSNLWTALASVETKKRFLDLGAEVDHMGPAEFAPFIVAEIAKWAQVIKQSNVKAR